MQAIQTYQPIKFFVITFAVTWSSWFIAAYLSYQPEKVGLQIFFMLPGLLAPCITALIMISGKHNKSLRNDFYNRLSIYTINPIFLAMIFLLMPIILATATGISLFFGQSINQFCLAHEYAVIQGNSLLSLLIVFLAPMFEELGWRGYGVDSIASRLNLFKTTLLFACLWGLWHLPLFFIKGYYHHDVYNMGMIYVANFFVSILAASVLMNWIYYKSNRSISALILFHFMLNLFSVLFQTEQLTKCIITTLLCVVSVIILIKDKEFFFKKTYRGVV